MLAAMAVSATMNAACSTSAGTESASDALPGQKAGQNAAQKVGCTPDAPRYHAFLASGSCANVAGKGGTWTARSLFPDAPEAIRSTACTYQWDATAAPPDVDALVALGAELLTRGVQETRSCDAPPLAPASVALTPLPPGDGGNGLPTGVTGCDVCGRVLERQVFVILPPDQMHLRRLFVTTESGRLLSFAMTPPGGGAQVFSAELPPAPDNEAYTPRASFYEAAF